jgi:hypothetical protein
MQTAYGKMLILVTPAQTHFINQVILKANKLQGKAGRQSFEKLTPNYILMKLRNHR